MARIPLSHIARAVAAVLAAVLLLGLAGSATASSPHGRSVCAKAAKNLRAAKSRLRKAQRGKASKKAVARARKAVKRAERSRRRACRAAPARPPVAAPPAPPAHGAPAPPASPPPHQPPTTPPTPPTSHALIAKALAEGRIDEETALRYRVFAEFGDDRLPAEFRGSPLDVTDTDTLDEVAQRWDELSPATRAVLDPFFIPPFNPGSWYEPGSGTHALARGAAAAAPAEPGADLCANTAPNMNRWGYVTAAGGKLRVWYENTRAGQLDKAISVAQYLDSGPWAKVIGVFREPLPDGGDLAGQRCRGFDPAVDLVLVGISVAKGRTTGYFPGSGCQGPVPGFVLVQRDLAGRELRSTVVHELAHLAQYAYSGDSCRAGLRWLSEATAAWTENHVGGLGPDYPEHFAPWFLDRPRLPLETFEEDTTTKTPRQYGAYLFFQWLAKNKGADAVSRIWAATEPTSHPIDAIQNVLSDLGYAGGFDEAWKQFALAGLNPREQVDWFKQWGLSKGAFIDQDTVHTDEFGVTFPVSLPHLSAEYHDLDFSPAVKGIEVTNKLAGVPGASVQAWLRIDDGGQERIEVRDISGEQKTTFCRRFPAENVQEIALVIANSAHAERNKLLEGEVRVRGTASCGAYDATSTITIDYDDGLTEVYNASFPLTTQWSRPLAGGGTETFLSRDMGDDMQATWSISGVSSTDGCTYSGQASWKATDPGEATLYLRDFGKGHPDTKYEFGAGVPFQVGWAHRSCPDGYQGDVYWPLGHGFQSESHPWNPDDQGMTGTETRNPGAGVTIKYDWSLSRREVGP
jgi:hypothetical protein